MNKGNPKNYMIFLEMANTLQPIRDYRVDGLQNVLHMSLDTDTDTDRLFVGDGMGKIVSTDTNGDNQLILQGIIPGNCVVHHTVRKGVVYYTYWNGETCGIKMRALNGNITDFNIHDDEHGTDWKPISIHASRINGDILIGMTAKKGNVARVIICNSDGIKQREIIRDSSDRHVYGYPHYITQASNRDTFVSDSSKHAVKIGDDRRYPGSEESSFDPKGICTDFKDRIIVCVSNTVHLLDKNGNCLHVLQLYNNEKIDPVCVCVDRDGFLHVGYNTSGIVNVYKLP